MTGRRMTGRRRQRGGTIMRMKRVLAAFLPTLLGLAAPAAAEVDETARTARWADLKAQIFGERAVEDGAGLVVIAAPDRAEDAAIVPVRISLAEKLRSNVARLYLVIDDNPSPLAGRFAF